MMEKLWDKPLKTLYFGVGFAVIVILVLMVIFSAIVVGDSSEENDKNKSSSIALTNAISPIVLRFLELV
jgi:hypothetical protein